jgi:hypothetical protein
VRRIGGCGEPTLSNQTLLELDQKLQEAMYVANELLKMLRRFHRDPRRYPQIRADITGIAQWLSFLFAQREHIAIGTIEQRPDLVKLCARLVCETCKKLVKDNCNRSGAPARSTSPPPIWKAQLEFLLTCTQSVGMEVFAKDCASSNSPQFLDCLENLTKVLLRMRRYLEPTDGGELQIEVEHLDDRTCAECGQVVEPAAESAS